MMFDILETGIKKQNIKDVDIKNIPCFYKSYMDKMKDANSIMHEYKSYSQNETIDQKINNAHYILYIFLLSGEGMDKAELSAKKEIFKKNSGAPSEYIESLIENEPLKTSEDLWTCFSEHVKLVLDQIGQETKEINEQIDQVLKELKLK